MEQTNSPSVDTRGVAAILGAVYAGLVWWVAIAVTYALAVTLGAAANAAVGVNVWKVVNVSK